MTLARALKLHLRVLEIQRTTLRVVTLRPQTPVRFSTNYFHDTWHILAGTDGAALLGRLLWGLAFQHHPGTAILIDTDHLVPTPFEADPPDPILLVPAGLTHLRDDLLRALRLRLRRAPGPPTTIRWHTFGMPAALAADERPYRRWHQRRRVLEAREWMTRRAGFICLSAPPALLREHALGIYRMHARGAGGYHPLGEQSHAGGCYGYDGEVQVIPGFSDMVSTARVARREIIGPGARAVASEAERDAVYRRQSVASQRLRAARAVLSTARLRGW